MMRFFLKNKVLFFAILLLLKGQAFAQAIAQGFNYQTTVRNNIGNIIPSQSVSLRFSFYSTAPSGTLVWQEDHPLSSDAFGHLNCIIGTGTATGLSVLSSFDQINWATGIYFLKVSMDVSGGSAFIDLGNSQLFSVPYSLYSVKTKTTNNLRLSELNDVDVSVVANGNLLKWNGSFWISAVDNDSDTVLYAANSLTSSSSDSALYVWSSSVTDTTLFAFQSDSALYSGSSLNATNSNSANFSDTALYAFSSPPSAWLKNGNSINSSASYLGTNDAAPINFLTNNTIKASIATNGSFTVNNSLSAATLGLSGNDGILITGTISPTVNTISGAGTKLICFPARGAFRAGGVASDQWDTVNIGNYSMAAGYNNKVRNWSFASGAENEAIDCSLTFGRKNKALGTGLYPEGSCVAIGDSNVSAYRRTVCVGKNNTASGSAAVAIGYGNTASGVTSTSIGAYCISAGTRSAAIGFHASALNTGSFVFADASSSSTVASTGSSQFIARASGGVVFYTDSLNTMGVTLSPGSGSWAIISDKNKKENFSTVDYESVLSNINLLKIKGWNYKSQSRTIRHIGPMAQDFYALFKVGENNTTITTADMDGVILAGIKALDIRINKLQTTFDLNSLKLRIEDLNDSDELNKRLDAIEAALKNN